nr:ABC transporter E family member 2-like [Tanacetum cinerariifolium]
SIKSVKLSSHVLIKDRVIVYEGLPSIDCIANTPQSLLMGMNLFRSSGP